MQNMTYFGQTQNLPGNEKVNYPINSAVDAQNYSKFVNSQIPSSQIEYGKRRMLKWLVPERGVVEMYINPQSIKIAHTKNIKHERSKGGFVIQYWGEDLIGITISGNTGSSGIEGINVLMDIYIPNITTNNLIGFHNMTSHCLVGNRVLPASLSIRNKKLTLTLK